MQHVPIIKPLLNVFSGKPTLYDKQIKYLTINAMFHRTKLFTQPYAYNIPLLSSKLHATKQCVIAWIWVFELWLHRYIEGACLHWGQRIDYGCKIDFGSIIIKVMFSYFCIEFKILSWVLLKIWFYNKKCKHKLITLKLIWTKLIF